MASAELEELAAAVERPVQSLTVFEGLTPDELRLLNEAIREARERERAALDMTLNRSLRGRLRRAVLWLLGWRP